MQLTLTDREAEVLVEAVKSRLDRLTESIVKADTRSFRDRLVAEGDALEGVYAKLGCAYPEWSEAKECEVQPSESPSEGGSAGAQ